MLLRTAELIACPGRRSTVIPEFRVNGARSRAVAVGLGNDQRQGLVILIVIVASMFDKMGDIPNAGRVVQIVEIRHRVDVHAEFTQIRFGQLRQKLLLIVRKHIGDLAFIHDVPIPHDGGQIAPCQQSVIINEVFERSGIFQRRIQLKDPQVEFVISPRRRDRDEQCEHDPGPYLFLARGRGHSIPTRSR